MFFAEISLIIFWTSGSGFDFGAWANAGKQNAARVRKIDPIFMGFYAFASGINVIPLARPAQTAPPLQKYFTTFSAVTKENRKP
jgi:hypothetical protein